MSKVKGLGPELVIRVGRLDSVAKDAIFAGADTAYWCEKTSTIGDDGLIASVVYQPHDEPLTPERGFVGRVEMIVAINEILAGGKVDSLTYEQFVKDTIEWGEDPEYGPPYDAGMCDVIVQVALFGEIKYG